MSFEVRVTWQGDGWIGPGAETFGPYRGRARAESALEANARIRALIQDGATYEIVERRPEERTS